MARVSIHDCLEKIENRFALVAIAADRVRQYISKGEKPMIHTKNKEQVTALREIAEGLIIGKYIDKKDDITPIK